MILRFFGSNNPKGNNKIYKRCYECPNALIMAEISGVPRSFERMGGYTNHNQICSVENFFLSVKKGFYLEYVSDFSRWLSPRGEPWHNAPILKYATG